MLQVVMLEKKHDFMQKLSDMLKAANNQKNFGER